jgi:hypothetical protein
MSATPASWEHKPFKEVVPIPYQATFDAAQFARLRMGLVPQKMENKWFIYFDEPSLVRISGIGPRRVSASPLRHGYRQSPTQAEEVSMRELSIPHAKKVRASAPIR